MLSSAALCFSGFVTGALVGRAVLAEGKTELCDREMLVRVGCLVSLFIIAVALAVGAYYAWFPVCFA